MKCERSIRSLKIPERNLIRREEKREMISCVTETVAEIEACPAPRENLVPRTSCVIEEIDFEDWGIGGNAVTPDMLKAVLEGKT